MMLLRVIILCFHIATAYVDRVQFIAADAPHYNFLFSPCRIEVPFAVQFHNRNR